MTMTHEQQLAAIREQIERGERAIEKQRQVVKQLESSGYPTLLAKQLLKELECALRADYATHSFLMRREAAPHLVAAAQRVSRTSAGGAEA